MASGVLGVGYFLLVLRIHWIQIPTARSSNSTPIWHGTHSSNGRVKISMLHLLITIDGLTLQDISIALSNLKCNPNAGESVRSRD